MKVVPKQIGFVFESVLAHLMMPSQSTDAITGAERAIPHTFCSLI